MRKHPPLLSLSLVLFTLTCAPAASAIAPIDLIRSRDTSGTARREDAASARLTPGEAKRLIAVRARQVILALKAGDMARLSRLVHPSKGVRFSSYAYVSPGDDLVFKRRQLASLWGNKKLYRWGEYDGSGDPIRLTFRGYYRRFIYDHDYSRAKQIRYNPVSLARGNTINNIYEVYSQPVVVEYHFPGFNPNYSGMDWKSLWLVFERNGRQWYLVGIVHDEWTT